jgi:hypothetical protein
MTGGQYFDSCGNKEQRFTFFETTRGLCDHLQTCSLTLAFSDAFTMSLNNIFGCLFGIVAGNTYLCNRSSAANGKE